MVTVSSYLLLLVQQGFDAFAIRQVARSTGRIREYTTAIIGLRLVLALGVSVIVAAYIMLAELDPTLKALLAILTLRCFTAAWMPQWCFLAIGKPHNAAVASILAQAIFLCGVALLQDPSQIVWAAAAQVAGEAIAAAYLLITLQKETGTLRPRFDWKFSIDLMRQSWPIAASLVCASLLYTFDVVALGWFSTAAQIGLYLACYRCITVFAPVIIAVKSTVLPRFSRAFPNIRHAHRLSIRTALPALVCALLLTLALGWGAEFVLTMLYGPAFSDGDAILKVLAWTLPIQVTRDILRQVLVAFNLQRFDALAMVLAVSTNIVVDVWLVPWLGALGCAISTVLSELVLVTFVFYLVYWWMPRQGGQSWAAKDLGDRSALKALGMTAICYSAFQTFRKYGSISESLFGHPL